jgi:hypothetical protein
MTFCAVPRLLKALKTSTTGAEEEADEEADDEDDDGAILLDVESNGRKARNRGPRPSATTSAGSPFSESRSISTAASSSGSDPTTSYLNLLAWFILAN